MMNSLRLLVVLFPFIVFAQQRELRGRVLAGEVPLHDVYVINATSGQETKTVYGSFSILAQPGDKLVVYSPKINTRKFILHEDAFSNTPYIITVNLTPQELDEVVIDKYQGVDEVSLGLVPADQKQYTYAERQYKAGGEFKPIYLIGIIAGGMPLDPVINAITGRAKLLKSQLETGKKEQLIALAEELYPTEKIINDLHVPEELAEGFLFYAVEDESLALALKEGNEKQVTFLMLKLSEEYLASMQVNE